jgi:hypothetical protein
MSTLAKRFLQAPWDKVLSGPPGNISVLNCHLDQLRHRFKGAVFERYLDKYPRVDDSAHVCALAALIGDVHLAADASIWYSCVLRGDVNAISIGCVVTLSSMFRAATSAPS